MLSQSLSAVKSVTPKQQSPILVVRLIALIGIMLLSHVAHSESITATDAAALYDSETTYTITRKGKNIGNHSLNIATNDNRVEVSVDSRITIRILKIPVFKFSYVSEEVWDNNQLLSVDSITKTNKDIETATLNNTDNVSTLKNNGGERQEAHIQFASNHWHMDATKQTNLFNTVKGTLANVEVQKIENETLQIGDTSLSVTHFKYSGDIIAESWYDENKRWVKLAFLGSDGSQITYLIDNP